MRARDDQCLTQRCSRAAASACHISSLLGVRNKIPTVEPSGRQLALPYQPDQVAASAARHTTLKGRVKPAGATGVPEFDASDKTDSREIGYKVPRPSVDARTRGGDHASTCRLGVTGLQRHGVRVTSPSLLSHIRARMDEERLPPTARRRLSMVWAPEAAIRCMACSVSPGISSGSMA